MKWQVLFHDEFKTEFDQLSQEVQDELIAQEKAVDENINSSLNMEDKPKLNREKNQVLPHK